MDRPHYNHCFEANDRFQSFPFNLPNELLRLIADFLDPANLARLVQTSRHFYDVLSQSFYRAILAYEVKGEKLVCEWALAEHRFSLVEKLLQLDRQAITDGHFQDALAGAASDGNLDVVRYLMDLHSERLNLPRGAYLALHNAAARGHLPVVKFFLHEARINVAEMCATGKYQTFGSVVVAGHLDVAEELRLAHNPIIFEKGGGGKSAIHFAAQGGRKETAAYLIRHKATVSETSNNGWTPLFFACFALNLKPNGPGYPASNSIQDFKEMIEFFVAEGADLAHRLRSGLSILHALAALYFQEGVVLIRFLVRLGADPNMLTRGSTALHLAVSERNMAAIQALLEVGAKTEIQDNQGRTPLHSAATQDYVEGCELLLEAGANRFIADENGSTPLRLAADRGYISSTRALLRHKDGVSQQNNRAGLPLLLDGVLNDQLEMVKTLVKAGADTTLVYNGGTAFDAAVDHGKIDMVRLFIENGATKEVVERLIRGRMALFHFIGL